jgi:uncharacterized protein (TIGR02266 family)
MSYVGAAQAAECRALLGSALELLQRDPNIPSDVLTVAGNIAAAIGALFEAEKASSDVDGKACVKHGMSSLSQTMALLQDVKVHHEGIAASTQAIARVMSKLYPLMQRPSQPQSSGAHSPGATEQRVSAGRADQPAAAREAHAGAANAREGSKQAAAAQGKERVGAVLVSPAAVHAAVPARAVGAAKAAGRAFAGPRHKIEANVGATTESNFFVGFSGEIAEGGVFVATYATFPVGTAMETLVTLPGNYQFTAPGVVRFVRDPMDMDSEPGVGIGFETLSTDHRELILRFVRKRSPMFYED